MLIAALFRRLHIPQDAGNLLPDFLTGTVKYLDGFAGEFREFTVFQINHVAGVVHQRRHIGSEIVLPDAHPQDQRAGFPDCVNPARFFRTDDAQRVGTLQTVRRLQQRLPHVAPVIHFYQMDDDFRVGFTFKMVAVTNQFVPQLHIVFDDAVVYHRKTTVIAQMGVCVFFRRRPVGSPTGVTDPCRPGHACPVPGFLAQIRDAPRHLAHCNLLSVHDSNACRIIAPVFQLFQAVQQERRGALRTGKSNNSTHKDCLPELVFLFSLFSVEALINSSARLSARLING